MIRRLVTSTVLAVSLTVAGASTASAALPKGWELPAMSVPAAQSVSRGEGVTVAVLDTGIRTDHPELKHRAKEGPDFLGGGDDKSEPWYGGHGTAMTSSVLDVAPEAEVLGLRVIRDPEDPAYQTPEEAMEQGGSSDNGRAIAQAITYATDHGADVISMSLGSGSVWNTLDKDDVAAVEYALSKGVVLLAAAGNEGNVEKGEDNIISYPAAYPGVIGVAAALPDGSRASFSSVHSYVDIAAPGVDINAADSRSSGRKPGDGTSTACALAAGVSALIVSKYPDLAPRQVAQVLKETASHGSSGPTVETGYGMVDADAALKAAARLTPQKAVPIGEAGAGTHFGPGDDGTPKMVSQGLDPAYFGIAAAGAFVALVTMLGGFLLLRSGRRLQQQGRLGAGGLGAPTGPPGQFAPPPGLPQQNPYQQPAPPPGQWAPRE
ncbi:hypothetical protein SUDANB58_04356 [Streptomyces sp. enrichment culture]|uniref:S8 family serine peptidase n=1 Tax=Streptomyces sp. enrichment culture TaxID=1795815 RepID=UPI003F5550AF